MTEIPFKPGLQVAVYSSGGWGFPRPQKRIVAKVHKSGKFTIEGSHDQWRPAKRWSGDTWEAQRAGANRYSGDICEPWSSKHDEMLAAARNADRWFNAFDRLEKVRRRPPEDASSIDEFVALVDRIAPTDEAKS